jgi:RNA polymerase sigma-70 factor (ECF subfamily)
MTPDDLLLTDLSLLGKLCSPGTDEAAWVLFLRRYQPVLLGWCRGLGLQPADADDVCQAVLGSLAQSLPGFRYDPRTGSFRGWLRATLTNAVRNFWRGRARRPGEVGTGDSRVAELLHQAEAAGSVDTLADEMNRRLEADRLLAARAIEVVQGRVKGATWQAFVLAELDGLPASEVAERLGIPVAYVYVYKDRVCKQLRKVIAELQGQNSEDQETSP